MKTFIRISFCIIVFGSLLFAGQAARWNHLSTPQIDGETFKTDPLPITDTTMQKKHPLNHFFQYEVETRKVVSRGDFPFKKVQTDTTKKTTIFI